MARPMTKDRKPELGYICNQQHVALRHSHLDVDARARPCPGGRTDEGGGGVAMRSRGHGNSGAPNIFALPGVRGRCPGWTIYPGPGWSAWALGRGGRAGARGRNEWTALKKLLAKVPCLWLGRAWDCKWKPIWCWPRVRSVLIKSRNPLGVLPSRPRPLCSWFRLVPLSSEHELSPSCRQLHAESDG